MNLRVPRGTYDILPREQPNWDFVTGTAEKVARQFGYGRITTPTFEATGLFERGVGSDTDIVQKEMYTFDDRGGDSLTLRPEGTAGVCRAYIQHGMRNLPQPVRLYYVGPMFRYERPQAGRLRQHHQFGVEAIGDESAQVDAEVIELALRFLSEIGMEGLTVKLNSIGAAGGRQAYLDALREYFRPHAGRMSQTDRDRLERSPLRLLDSKEASMAELCAAAPRSIDFLDGPCRDHWEELCGYVEELKPLYPGFRFEIDSRLVRGLDYYTRTVFEIHPREMGAQSSVLSGGRYDGLIEELGGDPTPGIGFGSGIERHILNLGAHKSATSGHQAPDVALVHLGEAATRASYAIASRLRSEGVRAVLAPNRSMRGQMRFADALSARFALIIGGRELEQGIASLKPLDGGEQITVPLDAAHVIAAIRGER